MTVSLTLSEFIDALGGTSAAARVFEVRPSAVSNWRAADRLPDRLHLRAVREAERRGLSFEPTPRPKQAA